MEVHAYKCPGYLVQDGISYQLMTVDSEDKLPKGWFLTLEKAAKNSGEKALAPEKKLSEKQKKRIQKLKGLPV